MTIADSSNPTVYEQPWWSKLESFYTPIFYETWWRDVIYRNIGKTALLMDYDNVQSSTVGELSYEVSNRWLLFSLGTQPLEAQIIYIFIDAGLEDGDEQYIRQRKITRKLAIALPRRHSYSFTLHQDTDAGIIDGFRDAGFTIFQQRTYLISPSKTSDGVDGNPGNKGADHDGMETLTGNLAVAWRDLSTKLRIKIREGNAALRTEKSTDVAKFIEFYSATLRAKEKKNGESLKIVSQVLQNSIERGRGFFLFSGDRERIHVAAAFLKDERYLYYYLVACASGCHPSAIRSIIWSGIKIALENGKIFDLNGVPFGDNGVVLRSIDELYKEFCGIPADRLVVKKDSHLSRKVKATLLSARLSVRDDATDR